MADKQFYDINGNPIASSASKQFYDINGEPIRPASTFTSKVNPQFQADPNVAVKSNPFPEPGETVTEQPSFNDYVRKYLMAPAGRMAFTGLGSLTGGLLAAPSANPLAIGAGGYLGGNIGNLAYQQLQYASPRLFGNPPASNLEAAGTAAFESGLNEAAPWVTGKLINAGKGGINLAAQLFRKGGTDELKANLISSLFKPRNLPVNINALEQSQLPFTYGQASKHPMAELMEGAFAGGEKAKVKISQQDLLRAITEPIQKIPTKQTVGEAATAATTQAQALRNTTNKLYGQFDTMLDAAPQRYYTKVTDVINNVPTDRLVPMKRYVPISDAAQFADNVSKDLRDVVGPDQASLVNRQFGGILDTLDAVRRAEPAFDKSGNPIYDASGRQTSIISYDKVKALKDSISRLIKTKPQWADDRTIGGLRALRNTISHDMEVGLAGTPEGAALQKANASAKLKAQLVNNDMAQDLLRMGTDPNTTYEEVASHALSDATKAEQFNAITGDRKFLSQIAHKKLYDDSFNVANQQFNPAAALKALETNPVYKEAIPSQELSNTKQLFRTMQSVVSEGETGKLFGPLLQARHGIGLAIGGLGGLISGHVPGGLLVGEGTILLGDKFASWMADPKIARLAIQAAKTPSNSPVAASLARKLFSTFGKGAAFQISAPDGNTYQAETTPEGKLKIVKNF